MDRILTLKEVLGIVKLSRRHLYRMEARGDFPRRMKIGARKVGWLASAITAWMLQRATLAGLCSASSKGFQS
jgi:prophage regulatory protein